MSKLGFCIRTIREVKQMSSAELATKAGISQTYVSLIEGGTRVPTSDVLSRVARALDVNVEVFLECQTGGDGEVGRGRKSALAASLANLAKALSDVERRLGVR
jgi:transcriptional regulator with XRE-family HTH domain